MDDQGLLLQPRKSPEIGDIETACLRDGDVCLIGTDEAGRGPLAGPVHAAAVGYRFEPGEHSHISREDILGAAPQWMSRLDDSKRLTESTRVELFDAIQSSELPFEIHACDHEVVDSINILQASRRAMVRSVDSVAEQACWTPQRVLVDGDSPIECNLPQSPVIEGDARSLLIAAASILAKVSRDRVMVEYGDKWPEYGFASNKGYPTAQHRNAIEEYGPTPIHRRSFSTVQEAETSQSELPID